MTLEQFKRQYKVSEIYRKDWTTALFDKKRFAHNIMEITNCKKLVGITKKYLESIHEFHMALYNYDIKMGQQIIKALSGLE